MPRYALRYPSSRWFVTVYQATASQAVARLAEDVATLGCGEVHASLVRWYGDGPDTALLEVQADWFEEWAREQERNNLVRYTGRWV